MSNTEKAPGLEWRKRSTGERIPYWVARRDLVKAGYRPKTVRLHYATDDPQLVARCHALQAEMLTWAGENQSAAYDGTFASLLQLYETHQDSPFHDLAPTTKTNYRDAMRFLMKHKGKRLVDAVTGADVRRWYKEIAEAGTRPWAYYIVNVLKTVLSFGSSIRLRECTVLREELRNVQFSYGARRKKVLTYAQVRAFCAKAHELGFHWMARCLTLQFEFAMRRRDVIGEYVTDRNGKQVWRDGLTWGDIDAAGIVRKLISKTARTSQLTAVHAIGDYPDVAADLSRTPAEARIGPLVINSRTGRPPTFYQCRMAFRHIARAAGIPDDVCQMDARAGANTEAYEAGVSQEDAMAMATHTEAKTNRGYLRDLTEQSRRAAAKRIAARGKVQ